MPYDRLVFRHLTLQEGESADKYLMRLKKQARYCNFGESLEDNLRDQLITMFPRLGMQRKLLEVKNIPVQEAMGKVPLRQSARGHVLQMANHNQD